MEPDPGSSGGGKATNAEHAHLYEPYLPIRLFSFPGGVGMTITLNGEHKEVPAAITVSGLLESLDIPQQRVAVELNEAIVKKDRYAATVLQESDVVEVVSFMGGGAPAAREVRQ